MKKLIGFVPVDPSEPGPNYPEYKGRCGMRCGNIWRCGGAKSFYSKLIRLGYQSKSAQTVLEKLNANPEWSAQKLAEEGHLICEFQEKSDTKLKSGQEEVEPADVCFLARHLGEEASTNVCYDFGDGKKAFIFGLTKTKSAVAKPEWSSVDCGPYATIEDLHVLCDRYGIDYVLYQLNNDEIEPQPDYVGDNGYIVVDGKKECFCGYRLYSNCIKGGNTKGVKRTCWRKRKCSSLLTYEELEEIWSATRVLEELNSRPQEYFHSLTEHLTQDSDYPNHWRLGDGCRSFSESIRFEADVNLRTSLSCYQ